MDKAPDAFRTISEVADDLDIPAHVLRFWETRFAQIKPMKRSGGRRYYRPDDVDLLRGIRRLLYGEGYTIRGVQRILREHGIKAVQGIADDSALAPASFTGPSFDGADDKKGHQASADRTSVESDFEADDEPDSEAESDEGHFDDDADESEAVSRPSRGAMDFIPLVPGRMVEPVMMRPATAKPEARARAADIPTPAHPPPAMPLPKPPPKPALFSGAEAYAPPHVRKEIRDSDRGKLQAVLDDLIGARQLIDRALKDDERNS